jgi:lysophospholipase L1-like esterase
MNICVFGDSIAWGSFDSEGGGWVNRLRNYCEAKTDGEVAVYNAGICGDTTEDLLNRFETEAEARDPQVIIFAIGINDVLHSGSDSAPAVNIDRFKKNIIKLIDESRFFTDNAVFIGLTRVEENKTIFFLGGKGGEKHLNKNIERFDESVAEICAEFIVPYISLKDLLKEEDLSDGLHPNAAGHQKIFEKIKWYLERKGMI